VGNAENYDVHVLRLDSRGRLGVQPQLIEAEGPDEFARVCSAIIRAMGDAVSAACKRRLTLA
jgi:hypothetical protein